MHQFWCRIHLSCSFANRPYATCESVAPGHGRKNENGEQNPCSASFHVVWRSVVVAAASRCVCRTNTITWVTTAFLLTHLRPFVTLFMSKRHNANICLNGTINYRICQSHMKCLGKLFSWPLNAAHDLRHTEKQTECY